MWLCDTSVKVFSKMSLKPLSSEIVSVWVLFYDVTVTKEMRSENGSCHDYLDPWCDIGTGT